jgi:hypothetical protein
MQAQLAGWNEPPGTLGTRFVSGGITSTTWVSNLSIGGRSIVGLFWSLAGSQPDHPFPTRRKQEVTEGHNGGGNQVQTDTQGVHWTREGSTRGSNHRRDFRSIKKGDFPGLS